MASGVEVHVGGSTPLRGAEVTVCVRPTCRSARFPPGDLAARTVHVAQPAIDSTRPVRLRITGRTADGHSLGGSTEVTVTPVRDAPNGPTCGPVGYFAHVTVEG
ncbi:hypothetical protein [Flexivirga caeni]|uniref:Uncharacterized protein n=1 Tax=Flexivirga caeni TaxID=2294115 RepID=A0A3M9M599_9MICO|nr:hypothetical protein [Flexivirga caeni]RNI20345.1 hypothetical protein EFY87_15490 [Flexivirga caeni]